MAVTVTSLTFYSVRNVIRTSRKFLCKLLAYMANEFSTQCAIAVNNTYGTTGSVTRSLLQFMVPSTIRDLAGAGGKWAEQQSWKKHQLEMQACGIQRSHLADWLYSSMRNVGALVNVRKVDRSSSLIEPFIWGRQLSINNDRVWYVTGNVAGSGYSGSLSGVDTNSRVLTVKSSFIGASFVAHADYFLGGKRIYQILGGAASAWNITQWEVVQAAVTQGDTTSIDVEVVQKQGTTGEIGSATDVTTGLVLNGPNNKHDVEAWCKNMHNVNLEKRVPFWYSTRRLVRRISSEYRKIYQKLWEENDYFRVFQELSLAERNRQDERTDRIEWMNAFFFGTRISDNQSLTGWESLESINSVSGATVDPETGGFLIAKRAEMIGVIPQLKACGRFADSAGAPIEIGPWLETEIYNIIRARRGKANRSNANEVDVYMGTTAADQFMQAYIKYQKDKLGDIVRVNVEDGQTSWGWNYRRFRLHKPVNGYINVFTDDYFDDLETAATSPGPGAALGRFAMTLDLGGGGGSIYPAMIASNRKQYTSGQIDDLAKVDKTFSCVMENPTVETSLTSHTTTAVVECPSDSLVNANFEKFQHTAA